MKRFQNKTIIKAIILVLIVLALSYATKEVMKKITASGEDNSEISAGPFTIINENFSFIPGDGICYIPQGSDYYKQGSTLTTTAFFLNNYIYKRIDNTETIGFYCPRNASDKKDNVVLQIEAYTLGGKAQMGIVCADHSFDIEISDVPNMYFLHLDGIKKVGDIVFETDNADTTIVLKRLYLVDYDKTIKKKNLLLGQVVVPD